MNSECAYVQRNIKIFMNIVFARFASECCCRCSGSDARVFRSLATDVWAMRTFKGLGSVENRFSFIDVLLDAHSVTSLMFFRCDLLISKSYYICSVKRRFRYMWLARKLKRRLRYMWPLASRNTDSVTCGRWQAETQTPTDRERVEGGGQGRGRFRYMWPLASQNADFVTCGPSQSNTQRAANMIQEYEGI